MSDPKLLYKLRSLAVSGISEAESGSAILSSFSGEFGIVRVLRLIDSTLMARTLVLSSGERTLGFRIANRRIVGVTEETSAEIIANTGDVLEDEDAAEMLAQAIVTLCATDDNKVLVRSEPSANGSSGLSQGGAVSIRQLCEALDFELWSEAADLFLRFVDDIDGHFSSLLLMKNGQNVAEFGEEARIEQMNTQFTASFGGTEPTDDAIWEPRIQAQVIDDQHAVIVASATGYFLCIDADADSVSEIMTAWEHHF